MAGEFGRYGNDQTLPAADFLAQGRQQMPHAGGIEPPTGEGDHQQTDAGQPGKPFQLPETSESRDQGRHRQGEADTDEEQPKDWLALAHSAAPGEMAKGDRRAAGRSK